ncbi:GNAT family N-acetyltransferase [Chryseolinea lacunae]|uniref:GNAT family N-acetyltransferase n=1 Tax=Chryseolinea lacunae TaxID=2801331 RepID=A0ABS1KXF9_9BACT|nr:GNAT family N-acetyltransferase [Chryseolinea lacunae]MBL0744020.1 GNAT family N-acetyltransferase [Chryseolinea lacunae]
MEFRIAQEHDIPAIVNLLKQSLGESLMPKSEGYWRWKHVENPFGPSPVLVCWEDGELIGVRAFMRWEWRQKDQRYRAVRAVDTATHPNHQGKGIFKKLTLSLVDTCTQAGDHFVFNTPNTQSKPGYLKMGWSEAGRLPVKMSIVRPIHMIRNGLFGGNKREGAASSALSEHLRHPQLDALLKKYFQHQASLSTSSSVAYLKWRYLDVPVANYVGIAEEQKGELTGLVIGRIKPSRFGRELRITDCFLAKESDGRELMLQLKEKRKQWGIDYITLSGTVSVSTEKIFRSAIRTSLGPVVTIRSLSLKDLSGLQDFNQWSPTLGDLELF